MSKQQDRRERGRPKRFFYCLQSSSGHRDLIPVLKTSDISGQQALDKPLMKANGSHKSQNAKKTTKHDVQWGLTNLISIALFWGHCLMITYVAKMETLLWISVLCAAAPFSLSSSERNMNQGIYLFGLLELPNMLKKNVEVGLMETVKSLQAFTRKFG